MQKATKSTASTSGTAPLAMSKRQAAQMLADGAGQAEALPPTGLINDERFQAVSLAVMDARSEAEFAAEIARLWQAASAHFLAIGRYLVLAHQKLGKDRYFSMVNGDEFPFSRGIAYKLKAVAEAVDGGRLPEDRLPGDYSVAYMLVTLSSEEFRLAESRNLVRADVKRREVDDFKRTVRQNVIERRSALAKRREQIVAMQRKLAEELRQIEAELGSEVIDAEAVEIAD
ncbi:hypothetical protein [Azospirillum canadense]|uniref:hypothetical protein n=1 Tax=Azospirillum canadense TaxID=403962 RepID=UPI0022270D32|nr:hypothetical protein [Azospirillum canadense]MCW2241849.1 hypothetical protein [Azospirillum canadense]